MTDTPDTITIRIGDEVLFRLHEGRRPLVYPDMVTRVSYETGVNVLHIGTVGAVGELDGVGALELDDSTLVAVADIDPDSVVVNPTASMQQVVET
jgi:hypothetical protein